MTNKVQADLGSIASLEDAYDMIIRASIDENTRCFLREYNRFIQQKIHALASIISEHENKINSLEYHQK